MVSLKDGLRRLIAPFLTALLLLLMLLAIGFFIGGVRPLTVVLPSISITAPVVETILAIAEGVAAIVLLLMVIGEVLPFLLMKGESTTTV